MSEALAFAPYQQVRFERTRLVVDGDLAYGDWESLGETLRLMEGATQWWLGDWCNYGEAEYGEKYAQAMDTTDVGYQALSNYAWVAGRVSTRVDTLSWTHHREVAKLEPEDQERWLTLAADTPLTTRELRRAITKELTPPTPPLPDGVYDVLLADPPWQYDFAETDTRAIENQYQTMPVQAICDLEVPGIVADSAVLFLWATAPKLREAQQVMDAWGFSYLTNLVWVKDKIGMGYWARGRHELLLIGKRGDFSPPEEGSRPDSVIESPRLEHSAKPGLVHDLIETMCPDRTYVELFARTKRDGWASWGNELT